MTISQLKELYLARQSCREFSAKPIAKDQLEEICCLLYNLTLPTNSYV